MDQESNKILLEIAQNLMIPKTTDEILIKLHSVADYCITQFTNTMDNSTEETIWYEAVNDVFRVKELFL